MALERNITIDKGESWQLTVYITDMFGQPLDLTDYTVTMRMKRSYASKVFIEFHTQITDPIKGEVMIWLDESETTQIKPARYVYDCIVNGALSSTNPFIFRFMEGIVNVTPSVSV